MSINEYIQKMQNIQTQILNFLDAETNDEYNFPNLVNTFKDFNIEDNRYELKSFLYLLSKIESNHHRGINFFDKIEQILHFFKDNIKKYFSNSEIFKIFIKNKRILLFLFEDEILIMDEYIIKQIISDKYLVAQYPQYFSPEIQPFIDENRFSKYDAISEILSLPQFIEDIKKELPVDFYQKRKKGENDNYICEIIQNDLIDDFVIYITKNSYPLNSTIEQSIYETNYYLIKNTHTTLIEYAAFYGSRQIFNYLRLNNVKLNPSLWIYAIHSNDAELIHLLESNDITYQKESYLMNLKESIKCQHNQIFKYIQNCYFSNENDYLSILKSCFKYYNFSCMLHSCINESSFAYMCKYDHYLLVDLLVNKIGININAPFICI